MIKIFVNARFLTQSISGVQRYAIECSRQIKKIYPNAFFLAPDNILHDDIANELNVNIIGRNKGHLWEQIDLPKYMAKNNSPALLNLANTGPLIYKNNYITIHDLAFYHHPEWNTKLFFKWYNFLVPKLAKRAKHIFTVSDTIRGEIIKYFHVPEAKISVTYNGLSQNILLEDKFSCSNKEKIILCVGSFNTRKNHHMLIKAFLESNIKSEYKLIIIGDKNKVFSESNIDEQTANDNKIEIIQKLSEDALANIYCRADIIASLSLYEGFGIPLLEGLYFGCKALCSDTPVYRELYDKYAYFCNPYNINDIKDALEKITRNSDKAVDVALLCDKYNYIQSANTIINNIVSDTSK